MPDKTIFKIFFNGLWWPKQVNSLPGLQGLFIAAWVCGKWVGLGK